MKSSTYLFFLLLSGFINAQKVTVTELVVSEEGMVSFNLSIDPQSSIREQYDVVIYTSKDGFSEPINVSISDLSPNTIYPIEFNGFDKIGAYEGQLRFRMKAIATMFPVEIIKLDKSKFAIGKSISLSWKDYHESGWYNVELYQAGEVRAKLIGHHRGTSLETKIPNELEKGEYYLRVTPTNDLNLQSEDYPITLKKAVKAYWIIGPLAAIGGIVALTGGDPGGAADELPNPPGPPDN